MTSTGRRILRAPARGPRPGRRRLRHRSKNGRRGPRARSAGSARAFDERGRDERAGRRARGAEHPVRRPCRGGSRRRSSSSAARQALEQPVDARPGCARRPRPRAGPRRSSRPGSADLDLAPRPAAPRNASAASRAPPSRTSAPRRRGAAPLASGSTTIAPGCGDGELLARDRLARRRRARPCARGRRSSAGRPGRRARSSRRADRRAPPRRRRRRRRPSANSASAAAVSTSNCVASDRFGRRAHARDRALEVGLLARRSGSARSSRARAARCTRRRSGPSAARSASIVRVAVDLPFVPTTWIEGYRVAGRRARRAACASARGRTPPARGRATRPSQRPTA